MRINNFYLLGLALVQSTAFSLDYKLTGDWELLVTIDGKSTTVNVPPQETTVITDEKYASLLDYDPKAGGWCRGTKLSGIKAQECTTRFICDPSSIIVKSSPDKDAIVFTDGKDYVLTPDWGTIGRLPAGQIAANTPVFISYKFRKMRLDSIIRDSKGNISLKLGTPHPANPIPPTLADGELRLLNIYHNGQLNKLSDINLFPILESSYPEPPKSIPTIAEKLLPKTMAKLKNGEKIRILAWGDSVTTATFLPNPPVDAWQAQFVSRLKKQFPKAQFELITEAWGGRNTGSYLAEPPGSIHNYQEKVLDVKADLIVSEFVNDYSLSPEATQLRYTKLLHDFNAIGAEWIILTPHYIRPDWMGLDREVNVDKDPRPYVSALRTFAKKNNIPLADASLRYGRLWRQGIPHSTIMINAINHPNPFGMSIFADALMELF